MRLIGNKLDNMSNSSFLIVAVMVCFLSCSKDDESPQPAEKKGYNMLLIGNSFFKPYAENLDAMAIDAGFEDHNSTRITRGGENGWASSFWNDSETREHQDIKAALDQGGVEFFGMTSGGEPENRTEGHKKWIEYALQNNPDISIFIAIPPIDFPADWTQRSQEYGFDSIQEFYDFFVNVIVHDSIIEPLRAEFPATNIFTIPTGWAATNLYQMNQDSSLLDDINFMGPKATSLFTDEKGHQGQIVIETGTLLWLNSIYGVDLSTFDYETGYSTDLHEIAKEIMANHDSDYKQ